MSIVLVYHLLNASLDIRCNGSSEGGQRVVNNIGSADNDGFVLSAYCRGVALAADLTQPPCCTRTPAHRCSVTANWAAAPTSRTVNVTAACAVTSFTELRPRRFLDRVAPVSPVRRRATAASGRPPGHPARRASAPTRAAAR